MFDLLNRTRVQQGFEQQVVADAPEQIERKVAELVDWLVTPTCASGRRSRRTRADRRRQYRDRLIGDEGSAKFHFDRTRLIDSGGREAQRVVDSNDRREDARELADGARNAVAAAAAMGVSAVGLGTLVTAAATTAAADVTGIIMASVLAAIGFFILPTKRKKAKDEMRRKISDVRKRLSDALRGQFAREITRSGDRIRESIAPYSRFVRARGRQAARHRAGTARDCGRSGVAPRAHRPPGCVTDKGQDNSQLTRAKGQGTGGDRPVGSPAHSSIATHSS